MVRLLKGIVGFLFCVGELFYNGLEMAFDYGRICFIDQRWPWQYTEEEMMDRVDKLFEDDDNA